MHNCSTITVNDGVCVINWRRSVGGGLVGRRNEAYAGCKRSAQAVISRTWFGDPTARQMRGQMIEQTLIPHRLRFDQREANRELLDFGLADDGCHRRGIPGSSASRSTPPSVSGERWWGNSSRRTMVASGRRPGGSWAWAVSEWRESPAAMMSQEDAGVLMGGVNSRCRDGAVDPAVLKESLQSVWRQMTCRRIPEIARPLEAVPGWNLHSAQDFCSCYNRPNSV